MEKRAQQRIYRINPGAILPATTHYNSFSSPALAPIITHFLDEPMPQA